MERSCDLLKHAVEISHYIVTPEAKYAITHCFQNSGSIGVPIDLLPVLTTVDLNDELGIRAAEIDNELIDGSLPSELKTKKSSITQPKPQHALRIGLMTTKAPGATDVSSHDPAPLTPTLSPSGRGSSPCSCLGL